MYSTFWQQLFWNVMWILLFCIFFSSGGNWCVFKDVLTMFFNGFKSFINILVWLKSHYFFLFLFLRENKWHPESFESDFGNAWFCLLEEPPWCVEAFKSHYSNIAVTVCRKYLKTCSFFSSNLKTWCHPWVYWCSDYFLCVSHREDWKDVVLRNMSERKDWWPMLHFTTLHSIRDSEENPKLLKIKSSLAKVLFPGK